jgi:hypothetical protein
MSGQSNRDIQVPRFDHPSKPLLQGVNAPRFAVIPDKTGSLFNPEHKVPDIGLYHVPHFQQEYNNEKINLKTHHDAPMMGSNNSYGRDIPYKKEHFDPKRIIHKANTYSFPEPTPRFTPLQMSLSNEINFPILNDKASIREFDNRDICPPGEPVSKIQKRLTIFESENDHRPSLRNIPLMTPALVHKKEISIPQYQKNHLESNFANISDQKSNKSDPFIEGRPLASDKRTSEFDQPLNLPHASDNNFKV